MHFYYHYKISTKCYHNQYSRTNIMRIVLSSLFNFNRRDIALLTKRMWYTHNVAKDVPGNFVIDGKRTSVKILTCTNEFLKLKTRRTRISIEALNESIIKSLIYIAMDQTKTMMNCMDNKRWICDYNNIHTLVFGHHSLNSLNAK